jgi:YidC/Oxa1 family membrane protein insertase
VAQSPVLEKAAEPITPSVTPEASPPAQLDQLVESTTSSSASQELAALELEHGFFARYTSGAIENILCTLHDQLALPWFLTIPVVIVGLRTVLIPINIWSMRIGARNMTVKPSLDIKISKIKELQTRGEQHKALLAQNELRAYMKQEGFRPLAPLGLPLLQGSLFVSFFWALREMGSHHLPSLTAEGALWFSDLTLAGPWYGLPLIASGLTLLSVEVSFYLFIDCFAF